MAEILDFQLLKAVFELRSDLNVDIDEKLGLIEVTSSGGDIVTFDCSGNGDLIDIHVDSDSE
jgi:hypothetical protein